MLAPISQDSSLAFTVPYSEITTFLRAVREIPDSTFKKDGLEQKKWIMKAARTPVPGSRTALRLWLTEAWTSFVDLLKVCTILTIFVAIQTR